MPTLPAELLPLIVAFQSLFSKSVWENAQTLLVGAILAIGKRTVTACLRVMGKSDDEHFQNYHRVLNRARWSALEAGRLLLQLLLAAFAPTGALVFGLDVLNGGAAQRSPPKASTAIRCALRTRILSKPVACAGSVVCCWSPCRGRARSGVCHF